MRQQEVEITSTDVSDRRAESVPGRHCDPRDVPSAVVARSLVGRSDERGHLDELLEAVRANAEPHARDRGRAGSRQDGAARSTRSGAAPDFRFERAVGVESEMELGVCRASSVVRADAGSARPAAGAAARGTGDCPRPERRRGSGSFSRGAGRAWAAVGGGGGTAAAVRHRRCAVVGPRLGANAGVRRQAGVCRVGRHPVCDAPSERGAAAAPDVDCSTASTTRPRGSCCCPS